MAASAVCNFNICHCVEMQLEILLPSALHLEESVTVSQLVSQSSKRSVKHLVRQAGRRKQTHGLDFFSGRLGFKQWGERQLSEQAMVEW